MELEVKTDAMQTKVVWVGGLRIGSLGQKYLVQLNLMIKAFH